MWNKICATHTQVLEVRTDSPVCHLGIFLHWSQVGPWRESQRWPKTRNRESSEVSYSPCSWQNSWEEMWSLIFVVTVEQVSLTSWWQQSLRGTWQRSGDSGMNEKCCRAPKYLPGVGAKSDFQQLYNSQAELLDETSSKIFGGWGPSEEKLIMMLLHH